MTRKLFGILFLLAISTPVLTEVSFAASPELSWSVPAGLRVGGPGIALMSGVTVGYRVGRFVWSIAPDATFQPAYNSLDGFIAIPAARVGAEGRYIFNSASHWWVGLGGGGMYYFMNKLGPVRRRISVWGPFGKLAVGGTPWGERRSVGPFLSISSGPIVGTWEGTQRTDSFTGDAILDVTLGVEWSFPVR